MRYRFKKSDLDHDGILLNAAVDTHTSVGIGDAAKAIFGTRYRVAIFPALCTGRVSAPFLHFFGAKGGNLGFGWSYEPILKFLSIKSQSAAFLQVKIFYK